MMGKWLKRFVLAVTAVVLAMMPVKVCEHPGRGFRASPFLSPERGWHGANRADLAVAGTGGPVF